MIMFPDSVENLTKYKMFIRTNSFASWKSFLRTKVENKCRSIYVCYIFQLWTSTNPKLFKVKNILHENDLTYGCLWHSVLGIWVCCVIEESRICLVSVSHHWLPFAPQPLNNSSSQLYKNINESVQFGIFTQRNWLSMWYSPYMNIYWCVQYHFYHILTNTGQFTSRSTTHHLQLQCSTLMRG